MKVKKTNQRELLFYLLYKEFKQHQIKSEVPFILLWKLMGEHLIQEFNEWTFMSYEVSTTMSKLKKDEPNLFEESDFLCKNGSTAIAYRIKPNVTSSDIKTGELRSFYNKIRTKTL